MRKIIINLLCITLGIFLLFSSLITIFFLPPLSSMGLIMRSVCCVLGLITLRSYYLVSRSVIDLDLIVIVHIVTTGLAIWEGVNIGAMIIWSLSTLIWWYNAYRWPYKHPNELVKPPEEHAL